jgi:hypothetical protein
MSTARKGKKQGRFKVGDWVVFLSGTKSKFAQVAEERGSFGIKGEHIYGLLDARESAEPEYFELPEEALEIASPPDKAAIMKYLKEGGLVALLRCNLGGGRDQPKAWLTYTPRGALTSTFHADQGIVGGATVPFFALHEYNVFTGKQEEVIRFLESFGLDRAEAQEVISTVGTAP